MTEGDGASALLRIKADSVDWRGVDDEIVVLDRAAAEYLAINPTGAMLWPLLIEGATEERLVATLQAQYGIDPEEAAKDVRSFVAMLQERELLQTP